MANKRKNQKVLAEKYERAKKLAAARQRKHKANMTEDQLEKKRKRDRERYHRLREEKKIKVVKEMTEAEKNKYRKIWKKKQATYRKKKEMEKNALPDSPPVSNDEIHLDQRPQLHSRQKEAGVKRVRRDRAKAYRELEKKRQENEKLKRKLEKYKKRLSREKRKGKSNNCSPSPAKQVKILLGKEKVSPKIKKHLFANFVLEKQVKKSIVSALPKSKNKQILINAVGSDILRKYRVQNKFAKFLPYRMNKQLNDVEEGRPHYLRKQYNSVKIKYMKSVTKFFEDDTVSKMLPGKKDFVRQGKLRKQRRVLLDSLKNLYKRYLQEMFISTNKLSYTTFSRMRPFWVTRPLPRDRETCGCIKHENMQLLVSALRKINAIQYQNSTELVKAVVCSIDSKNCMKSICHKCKSNDIPFVLGPNPDEISVKFKKWTTVSEKKTIKDQEKVVKRVVKKNYEMSLSKVKNYIRSEINLFKRHVFNMRYQANRLKDVRENLMPGELLYQVDFSQNYVSKCTVEIQAMHFGASKRQISLHTGIRHVKEDTLLKHSTFCTVSDNLDHHAHGVWAHMLPILEEASKDFPETHTVHIFSDSPSSQYRNRKNIHFMQHHLPNIFKKLTKFTWNFSEPGHGKGAMDGVGGSVKRNADQHVLHGSDITCAKDFVAVFGNSKTKVLEIPAQCVQNMKETEPKLLKPLKGIMSLRQITWGKGGSMHGRELSCFECPTESKCKHHLSVSISVNKLDTEDPFSTQLRQKKSCLKVSDVYTDESEEDNEPIQNMNTSQSMIFVPFQYEDITNGTFVAVSLPYGKSGSTKTFLAIAQGSIDDDNEVNVMFLKSCTSDQTMFYPDEHDLSYVSCYQILGTTPIPEIVTKGERLFYKFTHSIS